MIEEISNSLSKTKIKNKSNDDDDEVSICGATNIGNIGIHVVTMTV